ncbi:MAG TPA: non-canonical purine NTP pyrophosphatase [Planctomycetota bacterium]|nr:non-canonical purine NTP pyrophosphatase [Planctomycetota bacterium]
MKRLLLASDNPKKRAELLAMLAGLELVTPRDVGGLPPVEEDLATFAGNAAKKARSGARASGLWCLADDSGLEVEALDGAPGVRSARYAGVHGDDAANNAKLLAELRGVAPSRRGARFVCALALATPDGTIALEIEGIATGRILEAPRGKRVFGYDPLFLFTEPGFPETDRGFAELAPGEKARVSHRGRAIRELLTRLPRDLTA